MKTFAELGIKAEVVTELHRQGIDTATAVQEKAIPIVRGGRDLVVQSPTGTGKTLAFLLPLMERMKAVPVAQTLIVTPTRELTLQIARVAHRLAPHYGLRALALYGGQDIERQKEKIGQHPQLIIGTPGRLLDHLRHHNVSLSDVNKVVLDEADEMMKRGFLEDVETLLLALASDRQLLLFSATIPDRIRALSRRYMTRPEEVKIETAHVTLDTIHQTIIDVKEETKLDKLCELINTKQPYLMMVFCMTKQKVHHVAFELAKRGYLTDELSGDLSQSQRALVLRRFRQAELQILVTTDIAARGLDIEGVTHVVNFDIPRTTEDYIHRIGRTGRAGNEGEAITFVTARQYEHLRQIEAGIRARIERQRSARSLQKAKARRDLVAKTQEKRQKEKEKPRSKYESRKGATHSGHNTRSRCNPAGQATKSHGKGNRTNQGKKRRR